LGKLSCSNARKRVFAATTAPAKFGCSANRQVWAH
jgi:hypothetical protein